MSLTILIMFICATLIWAGIVDWKESILPNELVVLFLFFGSLFHVAAGFALLSYQEMLLGGIVAGAVMLSIRLVANYVYKADALGLGDVKLLAAAGVWLGVENFTLALAVGAAAGMLHGAAIMAVARLKTGQWPSAQHLRLPAGPGFIVGILLAGTIAFHQAIF